MTADKSKQYLTNPKRILSDARVFEIFHDHMYLTLFIVTNSTDEQQTKQRDWKNTEVISEVYFQFECTEFISESKQKSQSTWLVRKMKQMDHG